MKNHIAFILAAAAAVSAVAGEVVTSDPVTFRYFANGTSVFGFSSTEDMESWPILWNADEIVTATAHDGIVRTLTGGGSSTSATLPGEMGGVWHVANSNGDTATICIPWSVFEDGISIVSQPSGVYGIDTLKAGPDRKTTKRETLPIAYSGDDWAGDVAKASTITFTPPADSSLEATTFNRTGQGAVTFVFGKAGVWTVSLTYADGTVRTSLIDVQINGLTVVIR